MAKDNFESIKKETWYVWVAPDGAIQTNTLSPDMATVIAITQMIIGSKDAPTMWKEGFKIREVQLTITPLSTTEEEMFQKWKKELSE